MKAQQSKRPAPRVKTLRTAEEPPTKRLREMQQSGQKLLSNSSKALKEAKKKEEEKKEGEKEGADKARRKEMEEGKKAPIRKEKALKASEGRLPKEKVQPSSSTKGKGKEKVREADKAPKANKGGEEEDTFAPFLMQVLEGPPFEAKDPMITTLYNNFYRYTEINMGRDFRKAYIEAVYDVRSLKSRVAELEDSFRAAADEVSDSLERWSKEETLRRNAEESLKQVLEANEKLVQEHERQS